MQVLRNVHRKAIIFMACSQLLLLFTSITGATEWKLKPSLSLKVEYNDNILLAADDPKSVIGSTSTPNFILAAATERLNIAGNAKMNVNRYLGESILNTTDYFFRLSSLYQMERMKWELNPAYVQDSTLQSELLETGLALSRRQRQLFSVDPTWSWKITQSTTLELEYRFDQTRYSKGESVGLFDYQNDRGAITLHYHLTERDQIRTTFSKTIYRVSSLEFRAETYYAQAEIKHHVAETFQASLLIGGYVNDQTDLIESKNDKQQGLLLDGTIEKRHEKAHISLDFSRRIVPSGSGSLLQSDRVSVLVSIDLTANLVGYFHTGLHKNKFLRKDLIGKENLYYQLKSALQWHWTEQWYINSSYSFSRQDNDSALPPATANAANLMLVYRWPDIVSSP